MSFLLPKVASKAVAEGKSQHPAVNRTMVSRDGIVEVVDHPTEAPGIKHIAQVYAQGCLVLQ